MSEDLCIVIVTYNSVDAVGGLLDSIPDALGKLTAAIVVVDNGSSDATAELVEERGDCTVVRSRNDGYSAGINKGVAAGPPGVPVLILNPDAVLAADSVPPLVAALDLPATGIVAPQVREADGSLSLSLRREPSLGRALGLNRTGLAAFAEYVTDPAVYGRRGVVDWALGAALLVSRKCHDAVGGWDESYFLYSEETDLSLRARDLGFLTRYEPESVVTHVGGGSGRNKRTHAMQIVNRVRLYRRRHGSVASYAYYFLTVLSELTWAVRAGERSRFAVRALLVPSARPAEIGCSDRLLPD